METAPAEQVAEPVTEPATPVAQPAASVKKPSREVEEILVTGSRIPQKDLTTTAPVTVLGTEQIQASARVNIGDLLQQLPSQGNAMNIAVNNGGNGTTQVDLRSLGANRTLVLVDGKRFVYGGTGADNTVDLATIPAGMIDHIEILKDGASAVYGSDAIGGVVNIITRRRFNGVEATFTGNTTTRGDADMTSYDLVGGVDSENGGFMVGGGYYKSGEFMAADRDWARYALSYDYTLPEGERESRGGSGTIPAGRVRLDPATCTSALCQSLFSAYNTTAATYFIRDEAAANGWRPFDAETAVTPETDLYNYQEVNYLMTPTDRFSLFANGEYRIGDVARAYFQGTFVNRNWESMLAPEPLYNGFGVYIDADNAYNPFGVDIMQFGKRLSELTGRSQATDIDTFRVVAGMDGALGLDFGFLEGWRWDVSINYGRTNSVTRSIGSLNLAKVQNGLGPSYTDADGNLRCGTSDADAIDGCVPVDLFNIGGQGITDEMASSLGLFTGIAQGTNEQLMAEANITGELFALAAQRPVALAAGYAYRWEFGDFQPNPLAVDGLDADYSSNPTSGDYSSNEVYGELSIPIVDNMVGIEELTLDFAARYANFDTYGGTTTFKGGLFYKPTADVTLRGTLSSGFRAPSVAELYTGTVTSWPSTGDPCGNPANDAVREQCGAAADNGNDDTQQLETLGGNEDLDPEKSLMGTMGIVFTPTFFEGLELTLDYYNLKITDSLGTIGAPVILTACYPGENGEQAQEFCDLIERDPTSYWITDIDDRIVNLGTFYTSGIDLGARYTFPTEFGRFGLTVDANYVLTYKQEYGPVEIDGLGNYDLGVNPSLKANVGLSYSLDTFNLGLMSRYIGGFEECAAADGTADGGLCYNRNRDEAGNLFEPHDIPAYVVFDLYASYGLDWGGVAGQTTISGGMRNVLDEDPPKIYSSFLSYADPSGYDFLGRTLYVRLTHKF